MARMTRTEKTYTGRVPGSSWTVFVSNHSTYVPVSHARLSRTSTNNAAELSDVVCAAVMLDRGLYDGVQRVLFGAGFEFWLHRMLFLDAVSFLSHGRLSQPLERFILVDIDDVFVGRSGVRLKEADVKV